MRTHQEIDRRSLALARAIALKIDGDPDHAGLRKAQETCSRWISIGAGVAAAEWQAILKRPWHEVRAVLLEDSEEGRRLRQSSPFCGVLSVRERTEIYRRFRNDQTAA